MSRKRIILALFGLLFLLVAGFLLLLGHYFLQPAENSGQAQIVLIDKGMSLREVATVLEEKGIIKNRTFFILWARLTGYDNTIKFGEYNLSPAMSPAGIFNILTKGIIVTHPITFPEGFTAEQIGDSLERNEYIKVEKSAFLSLVHDPDVMERYCISGESLEGYLYPDTYHFSRMQSAESIVDAMISRFNEVISPYKERIGETGMTLKEVVTIASIVEKETGTAEERPIIASVFLNRLKRGMRLDSDPTVIYGIKDFNGNLTRDDLRTHNPYNTYVIRGLPPGPICNPGIESIRAVIYPADTEYLYFVSKNDGSHYFSRTLEEHNRNVMTYQKRRTNP